MTLYDSVLGSVTPCHLLSCLFIEVNLFIKEETYYDKETEEGRVQGDVGVEAI